jgi:hypothetical protein
MPVDKKIIVILFALVLAFSAGLQAKEGPAEVVIVPTALLPPTVVDFGQGTDFFPSAEYVPLAATPAPAVQFPRPLPGLRPSRDFGKSLFDLNLVAMLGLNLADYLTTREALKYPGLEESNPLMKPFTKSPAAFAAIKLGTTALTYWSMKSIFKKNRTAAWVLSTASNVLIGYVVANNLQNIQRAKQPR